MKVVLFCGGLGMRLRDYSEQIPKPLVEVGSRPIMWHLMKYYAHFGHKEFILCLGHAAAAIKNFFLRYDECTSNDFVLTNGGRKVELLQKDIEDWRITFVDTGLHSNIGERLRLVRDYVGRDEMFMANYADGLADLDLHKYVHDFSQRRDKVGCFLSVPAPQTFHVVHTDAEHNVVKLEQIGRSSVRINGGFLVLRREIFEYMKPGEELISEPFSRLIEKRALLAVQHEGFWQNMDTFKDKVQLDQMVERDEAPWQVWKAPPIAPEPAFSVTGMSDAKLPVFPH
ncbi:MAG: sugar phosphate nucleotidyltransferase [Polyangiaceae bacterium]